MHPFVSHFILPMIVCQVMTTVILLGHVHEIRRGSSRELYLMAITPLIIATTAQVYLALRLLGWLP
jgi:hypothetical protein